MKKSLLFILLIFAFVGSNAQAPIAPSGLTATGQSDVSIDLAWVDNSDNETSFIVFRSLTSGSGYSNIATLSPDVTSYSDETVGADTVYYYQVHAVNGSGSGASDEVSGIANGELGNTTVFPAIGFGNSRQAIPVTMTFDALIESISMYHEGGSGNMFLAVYADESGLPGARLGVTPLTAVSATAGWQTIALSSAVATSQGQQVWLAWSFQTMPGVRYTHQSLGTVKSPKKWTGSMPTDFGSSSFVDYDYSIYAIFQSSSQSAPSTPTNLQSSAQADLSIDLTWTDNSSNESSFVVERSAISGHGFQQIASLPLNSTSYKDESTSPNTEYFYRVGAVNSGGTSYSAETSTTAASLRIGNTDVFTAVGFGNKRTAIPITMPADGLIESISMYHEGGSGNMLLAVYADNGGLPGARLGVTSTTSVNGSAGWQTINLTGTVETSSGQQLWLAWSYQNMPGIRYKGATSGAAKSLNSWTGTMPSDYGSGSLINNTFSIYANYQSFTLTAPAAPTGFTATLQNDLTVDLAWTDNADNESSYFVERSTGGGYSIIATLPVNSTSYTDASVTNNQSYDYRIRAFNSAGSANSSVESVSTGGLRDGYTEVFTAIGYGNRRCAIPVTMSTDGWIESISMYHESGSGDMLLAVYADAGGVPGSRLGVTATTGVSGAAGWQTIDLISPVVVTNGQQVWLAWSYQTMPGIRYKHGNPGIAKSSQRWTGSMPTTFGGSTSVSNLFSIYAELSTVDPGGRIAFNKNLLAAEDDLSFDLTLFPNPFKQELNIEFDVQENQSFVHLSIMDVAGREIDNLFEGEVSAGSHNFKWDGLTNTGKKAISGVYILQGMLDDKSFAQRVILK